MSALTGSTVTDHYWTVVDSYGTPVARFATEGEAFREAMDRSEARVAADLPFEDSLHSLDVTYVERVKFRRPDGVTEDREVGRQRVNATRADDRRRWLLSKRFAR
jgi:hypothetical protein